MIVAVSGTPGTGKTAVGRLLAKRLGWKFLELNSIAEKEGLYCGYDSSRRTRIVDVGKVRQLVSGLDYNVVVASHYSHDMDADAVVILRTEIKELGKRLARRKWSRKKVEENIQAEIFEVCRLEAAERGMIVEVDTTCKKPVVAAEEAYRKLRPLLK